MKFAKDDSARVPFSAIGVLLLSAAIVTTAMLVRLDTQIARETAREPEISESAELLASAKQDVARLLSWSVQGAASEVARAPVVAGFRGPIPGGLAPEACAELEECVARFNEERVRREALRRLREHMGAPDFTYRRGESVARAVPAENWTDLTLAPVNMSVRRSLNPLLWGPKRDSEVHWVARVPVNFTVTKPGQKTYRETAPIETFVPARFPFVRNLTEGFARDRLGQWGPLFQQFTAASLGQVWVKGYLQWAGKGAASMSGDVYGEERNGDVERILNAVLLLDEGFQFQTVDPGSLWSFLPDDLRKGFESAGDLARRVGDAVETVAGLEELLAGPEAADARKEMRKPRSADEFLVCPFEPLKADIPAGSRVACRTAPEDDGACGLCRSDVIRKRIGEISDQVYSAEIRAEVTRQAAADPACPGSPSGWGYVSHSCSPAAAPAGALGADICSVSYTRTCTETQGEETTTYSQSKSDTVSVKFVASDHSRTDLELSVAGLPGASGGDVAGAFSASSFEGRPDPNLADALAKYRAAAWTYDVQRSIFQSPGASGSTNPRTVRTDIPPWLETAAVEEVRSLLDSFRRVQTGPKTTPENLTHYGDYLRNVSRELHDGTKEKARGFADRPRFADGGTYKSAAAKVLYLARAWFIDSAMRNIRDTGGEGATEMDRRIDGLLRDAKGDAGSRERAADALRSAGELFKGGVRFPLGLNMTLSVSNESANRSGWARGWSETVRLDVDQEPDLLNGSGDSGFVPLSVRTWSLPVDLTKVPVPPLSPTIHGGVSILPPPFPWVVTANAWVVNVKGEFELTVEDAGERVWSGEGFEGVKWVRENRGIYDPATGEFIGDNKRMGFDFWTVIPMVVPSGPPGVGDRLGASRGCSGEFRTQC